jgi:hypothetical protein
VVELSHSDPDQSGAGWRPVRGVDGARRPEPAGDMRGRTRSVRRGRSRASCSPMRRSPGASSRSEAAADGVRPLTCGSWCAIDPSAQELQRRCAGSCCAIPRSARRSASSERLLLSRFMVSRDFRPVQAAGARRADGALIAVSAPPAIETLLASDEPRAGRLRRRGRARHRGARRRRGRACSAAPAIPARSRACSTSCAAASTSSISSATACSVVAPATPALILQDDAAKRWSSRATSWRSGIGELHPRTAPRGPGLVPERRRRQAGRGGRAHAVQATLAGALADAGVPAVIAMQGQITMATVAQMMPVFFRELLRDGQIDRALAAARGAVQGRERRTGCRPCTRRLTGGRMWYTPGFRGGDSQEVWRACCGRCARARSCRSSARACSRRPAAPARDGARLAGIRPLPARRRARVGRPAAGHPVHERSRSRATTWSRPIRTSCSHDLIEQHRALAAARGAPAEAASPTRGSAGCWRWSAITCCGDPKGDPHRILAELGGLGVRDHQLRPAARARVEGESSARRSRW